MEVKQKQTNQFIITGILILSGILFLLPKITQAADFREPEIKIFDGKTFELKNKFYAYHKNFQGGISVTSCDLDRDGFNEIITAPGPGGGPFIRIFDQYGKAKFTPGFYAYDFRLRSGVNVACGDLDGDGQAEIITAPKYGGSPHVRIFNRNGQPKFTLGFYAFDENFKGGINLAVGDIDGGGLKEIITAPSSGGSPHMRIFNRFGESLNKDFYPFHQDFKGGVKVAIANVDGGSEEEIIVAVENYDIAWVKVIKIINESNTILGNFQAFPDDFKGGVNVAAGDIDQDGYDEVIVSVNSNGGPQVRAFEAYGQPKLINFFAYENDFRAGVYTTVSDLDNDGLEEIIVAPGKRIAEGRTDLRKYIEIDISEQKLTYYENGHKLGEYPVSTGKVSMPTPLGTFKIISKAKEAYSKRYTLYMPYWMQFTKMGHGVHGLPYWKLKRGGVIYEGADHLGRRVSHGCVRLPVEGAAKIFAWVEMGTVVIIHN